MHKVIPSVHNGCSAASTLTLEIFFMEIVPRHEAAMLAPVIQRNILLSTRTIWSDGWRAYHQLPQLSYVHKTVDHLQHFVNPATGVIAPVKLHVPESEMSTCLELDVFGRGY